MNAVLFAQFINAAGPAILVVCSLALLGIIGFFFVCYFAHCFLTVIIDSAAGIDEIRWPSESVSDWMTKPIYVLWVLLPLLFVPSIVFLATGSGIAFGLTFILLLWLVSPVMFISSLAAQSWMAILYGPFLKRWMRYFHAYVIFLAWTGVLVAAGTMLLGWSLFSMAGVGMSALLVPPIFLLYCRVFGRYGWYISTRRQRKAKKKKTPNPTKGLDIATQDPWAAPDAETEPAVREATSSGAAQAKMREEGIIDKAATRSKSAAIRPPADVDDRLFEEAFAEEAQTAPLAASASAPEPEVEEDEWTPNKKPYIVMTESQARASWVDRKGTPGDDQDGYSVEDLSLGAPVSLWNYYVEREKKEEALREQGKSVRQYVRPRKPPTLKQAMTREIFSFLFYPHSLRTWMNLAIFFGALLTLLNLIVYFAFGIQNAS